MHSKNAHHPDALHKSRLLNVEEKPFKRITKQLPTINSIAARFLTLRSQLQPDASGADEVAAAYEIEKQKQLEEYDQFRENVLLDFAAFETFVVRIQFLLASNVRERERYASRKLQIQATSQEVRDNTAELRLQLEEARKTLALRKVYDDLAEKITSNRLLRPREDQHANLEKLNAEIAELERESKEYAQTWAERREQFGRIIDEGMHLRRLIRDEKEEVERREGMEKQDDGEDGESGFLKGRNSGFATPRNDDGESTPLHPAMDSGSSLPTGPGAEQTSISRARSPLHNSDIALNATDAKSDHTGDINMAEDGEVSVDVSAAESPKEGLILDEREASGDQMDTS